MKVLILTVTAGYGHNSTAAAIAAEFERMGTQVVTEDMYRHVGRLMYNTMDKGYLVSAKYLRGPYHTAYGKLENSERASIVGNVLSAKSIVAKKFEGYFAENHFDAVVCTHVFSSLVMSELRERGVVSMPIVGICTDYCLQPFWENVENVEAIVTASPLITCAAKRRGIPEELIRPFGLPVNRRFLERGDKRETRLRLGLDTQARTVLIMGGSMGFGKMEDTVRELDELGLGLQLVCICGNNEKLREELVGLRTVSRLMVLGFVNNVDEYMDAADCIVTKPGGLTVTEALNKKKPMILTKPIPGHEERNKEFLLNCGAAISVSGSFTMQDAVCCLLQPGRLELMERACELVARPDATARLCRCTMELAENGS